MDIREVIPRTRSYAAAGGAFITSAGVVTLTVGILTDTQLPALVQAATLAVGGLFALALLVIAMRLLSARGGLLVDVAGGRLGIGVTSERDTWWLPLSEVLGLRVVAEAHQGETIERWLAVLELRDRASVALARSEDRETVIVIARRLATVAGLPGLEDEVEPPDAPVEAADALVEAADAPVAPPAAIATDDVRDGGADPVAAVTVAYGVRRRAALQGILFFFGTSLGVVGAGMFARVEHDPVFGFLFGPLLGLLGAALLGITVAKRFATEELRREGASFQHGFRLGRWRWGQRRILAPEPRWRLYVHGMRGAHLELVGRDGTLILGSGATTRSDLDLEGLARLRARLGSAR